MFFFISLFAGKNFSCEPEKPKQKYSFQLPVYTIHSAGENQPGYYFFSAFKMRAQEKKTPEMQFIMDEKGNLVYYNPNSSVTDFKILPDGRISCYENGKIFLFDKSMHKIDSLSCVNGAETDPHDFTVLPNGHYLMIGARTAEEDLSKLFLFTKEKIAGSKKAKVKYGVIQEFDAQKNLVYEWNSRPWFKIENMDPFALKDSAKVDLTHFNSVEPLADGNFLVSARYSNEIVKVNRED